MNGKTEAQNANKIKRREMLKATAAATIFQPLAPVAASLRTEPTPAWSKQIISYLEMHARPDGGYGWEDQPESHMSPTAAVIGCYQLLGQNIPRQKALAEFVSHNRTTRKHANPGR